MFQQEFKHPKFRHLTELPSGTRRPGKMITTYSPQQYISRYQEWYACTRSHCMFSLRGFIDDASAHVCSPLRFLLSLFAWLRPDTGHTFACCPWRSFFSLSSRSWTPLSAESSCKCYERIANIPFFSVLLVLWPRGFCPLVNICCIF